MSKGPQLSRGLIKTYKLGDKQVFVYPNDGWDIFTGGNCECVGLIRIDKPEPYGTIYSYWENSYKWSGDNGHWRTKRFNGFLRDDGHYKQGGEETGSRKDAIRYFNEEVHRIRKENPGVSIYVSEFIAEYPWMTIDKFYEQVLERYSHDPQPHR